MRSPWAERFTHIGSRIRNYYPTAGETEVSEWETLFISARPPKPAFPSLHIGPSRTFSLFKLVLPMRLGAQLQEGRSGVCSPTALVLEPRPELDTQWPGVDA